MCVFLFLFFGITFQRQGYHYWPAVNIFSELSTTVNSADYSKFQKKSNISILRICRTNDGLILQTN